MEVRKAPTKPPPVWLICNGVGAQWPGMLKQISQHPLCQNILEEISQLLLMQSFDLTRLLQWDDQRIYNEPKYLFVGLAVVQCLQVVYCDHHNMNKYIYFKMLMLL